MMTTLDVSYRPEVRPAADVTTAKTVGAVTRQPRVRPVQMPKGGEQTTSDYMVRKMLLVSQFVKIGVMIVFFILLSV